MAVELTPEEQAAADAQAECLTTLFGDGAMDAWLAAQFNGDTIMECIKASILECLENPDTNPITKEFLGDVIQGKDVDADGKVG